RADLDAPGEVQFGVEDAVAEPGDPDLLQLVAERLQDVAEQVVGHRPGRHHTLLGERDRGGLDGADPDREVTLPRGLAQQNYRLVGGHFNTDTDDVELVHVATVPGLRGSGCGEAQPAGGRSAGAPGG